MIEKQKQPVPEAAHKVGESTVEIAAHYLRDILGFEEHLQTQQIRKFGLRMFFSLDDNQDIAQRVELGSTVFPPLCTYQLDRGRLENFLSGELPQQRITFLDGCKVQRIILQPQSDSHRLHILHDGNEREIRPAGWWMPVAAIRSYNANLGLPKRWASCQRRLVPHRLILSISINGPLIPTGGPVSRREIGRSRPII